MKSIFKLLVILVICLVGIGLWRGWFGFSSSSGDNQKDEINVSVDKGKIKEDVQKAKTKVAEEVKELSGKAKAQEAK
jgi:hypothetical protein